MFGADNLVGWVIGRLLDAGYKKLSTRLLGTDQNRALKDALTAAVETTVREIGPSDEEEVERVARRIDKAFRRREPVPQLPGEPSQLEALQAGIAAQLSVLDDGGQTAASPLGVPVSDVAAKLTEHLVHEITDRGAGGGPLFPLAVLLGQDRAYQLGEQIKGMVAELLERDAPAAAAGVSGPVGWPLAEVTDPFALEVHRPVEPEVPQPGLPVLPVYVPREHDAALAQAVTAAAAGTSGIAVLVGGSSTGKTRACWEALELLRDLEPGWQLWHPIDPEGALAGLPGVAPRTVMWLNEAQRYLGPADSTGEQVAARLRELLREQVRGPVLVLATLRPDYWAELTVRPPGGADPHAQARELLTGDDIPVPAKFTDKQLRELAGAGDPRLAQAAAASRDGQVIQYLAGAPELLDRYRTASPAARALIDAAMDAVRLGMRGALPRAFLEMAAPGYLTDTEWNLLNDEWLEQALTDTARSSMGVPGPLAPIRPRPAPGALASVGDRSAWQLADYLDQEGRRIRRELIPPAAFWAAAASCADPADLTTLAQAAENRGLYRDAARLDKRAAAHGYPLAGEHLVSRLHTLHPGDRRPAEWAVAHASIDNPAAVAVLLGALQEAGATEQATTLAGRAAADTSLDNPAAVATLLGALQTMRATESVTTLLDRDPAAHTSVSDPEGAAALLDALREAGATGQVSALASRSAADTSLDNLYGVFQLLGTLQTMGATDQATTLTDRVTMLAAADPAAALARLSDPASMALPVISAAGAFYPLPSEIAELQGRAIAARLGLDSEYDPYQLLEALQAAEPRPRRGAKPPDPDALIAMVSEQLDLFSQLQRLYVAGVPDEFTTLTALLDRAAADISIENPDAVVFLLPGFREAGTTEQVTALASRAAADTSLDNPDAVARLLGALQEAGATEQVTTLASRAAADTSLDNPDAVARLLGALQEAGATEQVTTLASRAAADASLDDPGAVADLLNALRVAEATDQVTTLLSRGPATHTSLAEPGTAAELLDSLRVAGAIKQVTALASRAAADASLDDPEAVARLLGALWRAGATEQVTALASRAAADASLDDPGAVADLLRALRVAEATDQVTTLLSRNPAAHASLAEESAVTSLLGALHWAGARAQVTKLIERLPAVGMFELLLEQKGLREQFRFGREADGHPAKQWTWTDVG